MRQRHVEQRTRASTSGITRRAMIYGSVAGTLAPLAVAAQRAIGPDLTAPACMACVMFDASHAPSRAFAKALDIPEPFAFDVHGDVGAVLFGPRAERWRAAGFPIVGLTTSADLHCIEHAAATFGWRAVLRAECSLPGEAAAALASSALASLSAGKSISTTPLIPPAQGNQAWAVWLLLPREALAMAGQRT